MERRGELLLVARDHVERARDAGVEAGGEIEHGRHTRDERALGIDVRGPGAEALDARCGELNLATQVVDRSRGEPLRIVEQKAEVSIRMGIVE